MSGDRGNERELAAAAVVLDLLASGAAASRADLARATAWAKSTVTKRVEALLAAGVLVERGPAASTGGRPPTTLGLNPRVGVLLAADVGPALWSARAADFSGATLAEVEAEADPAWGPDRLLAEVAAAFEALLDSAGRGPAEVRGVAIGLPCPVDHRTGVVLRPPVMPGWDRFDVPGFFAGRYDAPVLVDNDVNLMALGEWAARGAGADDLLFVKVGAGIGAGIVSRGELYRGADGAAGDIGHLPLPGHETVHCPCGKSGCVEAVASGSAVARALADAGAPAATTRDVVRLVAGGDALARRAVREAIDRIGEVLAGVVSFYNPTLIVLGGEFTELPEELLAGIRGAVYRRALPLATRSVQIELSAAGDRAGVAGGTVALRQHLLSPTGLAPLVGRLEIPAP